jgi:hypothetical protein
VSRWGAMTPEQKANTLARVKAWREKNKAKIQIYANRWAKKNADKKKATTTAWQKANPDNARAACRRWHGKNPQKVWERNVRARARKRAAAVPLTNEERAKIVGFYAEARALTELTGYSYHVDHIKPLAKGGLHHPSNLQVLRGVDNLKKGAKYAE